MITIPDLKTSLLDLLHEIKETDISIVVGGGFGIYLKRSTERNTHTFRRQGVLFWNISHRRKN